MTKYVILNIQCECPRMSNTNAHGCDVCTYKSSYAVLVLLFVFTYLHLFTSLSVHIHKTQHFFSFTATQCCIVLLNNRRRQGFILKMLKSKKTYDLRASRDLAGQALWCHCMGFFVCLFVCLLKKLIVDLETSTKFPSALGGWVDNDRLFTLGELFL